MSGKSWGFARTDDVYLLRGQTPNLFLQDYDGLLSHSETQTGRMYLIAGFTIWK